MAVPDPNLARFEKLINALRQSYSGQATNEFNQVSPLWATMFQTRDAAKELEDFSQFLSDDSTSTHGAAGKYSDADKERLARYHRNWVEPELLDRFPLTDIGSPTVFDYGGRPCNTAYLENLSYFQDIERLVAPRMSWSNLDVVEIGAGYGAVAALLIRAGVVRSYTIIDLPENLELGAFYLTSHFPDLPYRILSRGDDAGDFAGLTFVTAGNIEALAKLRFDLAINTDSLGEMPAETAQAYVRWISEHLRPAGCFYSKNGHRRSSTGVKRASELGYDRMDLLALEPIKTPSTVFADHSHLVVLTPKTSDRRLAPRFFDALCNLYAIGLHEELRGLSASFADGSLNDEQTQFLNDAYSFVDQPEIYRKPVSLHRYADADLNLAARFLAGLAEFLAGNKTGAERNLAAYLAGARSHVAESIALFVMNQLGLKPLAGPYRCGTRTQFMVEEIQQLAAYPRWLRGAIYALRNDLLRKKLHKAEDYRPSALLAAKNIMLNVKEGKGLRVERH